MLLLIDNYDSFTYNISRYFEELGQEVLVYRNDKISLPEISKLNPDSIVLSPGPGSPKDAGICIQILTNLKNEYPILGICLGHQCIAEVFGATVAMAPSVMHGKVSNVFHSNEGLFKGCEQGFTATRYHSLAVRPETLPDCLKVTAWTENAEGEQDVIMGISHRTLPIMGVQFHPESVLSAHGHKLLENFLHAS